ncbi:hypothetical protein ACI0FS_01620 [Ochrobactrum quorumnocens]|uniref:hypothetical protein n=1 Tax=Ochrobactrum quorumnocens TaxID=271865 RepID=UPI003855260F
MRENRSASAAKPMVEHISIKALRCKNGRFSPYPSDAANFTAECVEQALMVFTPLRPFRQFCNKMRACDAGNPEHFLFKMNR